MKPNQLKPGDLVRVSWHGLKRDLGDVGVILERVAEPMAMNNDVFKILWRDGTIGNNIWDYDLDLEATNDTV
jgi:hypothetical protein